MERSRVETEGKRAVVFCGWWWWEEVERRRRSKEEEEGRG